MEERAFYLFPDHREIELFTMKSHLLENRSEDLHRFARARFRNTCLYKHFDVVIWKALRETPVMRTRRMQQTSCELKYIVQGLEGKERWDCGIDSRKMARTVAALGELKCVPSSDRMELKFKKRLRKNS